MNRAKRVCLAMMCAAALLLTCGAEVRAQKTPVPSRVTEPVDETRTARLIGNVHPLARPEFDAGALADSQPMTRMMLLLQRSAEQETALRQLMDGQQDKSSPQFHAWLTPEQFGKQFGPSDRDIQAVTDWLTRQGFSIGKVSAGRTVIEFSGTVAQVRHAFQTEMHRYTVKGETHFANVSDPSIPMALKPVVAGVVALQSFPKRSQVHRTGIFQKDLASGQLKPLFTYTDKNGTFYGVGPADFAKIYNVQGFDGTGQTIAIVGDSNINIQDVRDFRTMFGLPANDPLIKLNGPDPGLTPDEIEADLDVEWAGAVAPAAQIIFVVSQDTTSNPTQVSAGIDLSALYIIDNNLAPVMSESFGSCELSLGTSGNAFYNALWQQAAAQGITAIVASGDNGSAGCDPAPSPANQNAATLGLAVSGLASTPYNVAAGGTDFDQFGKESTYWNSTNASGTQLSAKGYIPEIPWNDSACAAAFPTVCASVDPKGGDLTGGSGGPSNCAISSGSTCSAGYPKPSWQSSLTPADGVRDLPDVSFLASNGQNLSFYIVCQSDANPNNAPCDLATSPTSGTHNFSGVGGTSASAPAFAGVMALVNQKTGQRQGNANYVLYALAKNETFANCNSTTGPASNCVFNDVTKGNNSVACVAGTRNCSNKGTSGFGVLVDSKGNPAFQALQGYDMATGLGSINVANLLAAWSNAAALATNTTLALNGGTGSVSITHGASVTVHIAVAPASGTGTPTGLVTLRDPSGAVLDTFTLANGSFTGSTTRLVGGTPYNVTAHYGGDGTFHSSDSAPISVTVAKENSLTAVSFVAFSSNGTPTILTGPQNIAYGSPYVLRVDVTGTAGVQCATAGVTYANPCPTGTIALTDSGAPLNDFPNAGQANATNVAHLNNQGFAEDQPVQFAPGAHIIAASYSGDASYNSSQSTTPFSITVTKAATTTAVTSSLGSITAGTSVTLTAKISSSSNGAGVTGTVQFSNGSTSLGAPVTCTPTSGAQNTSTGTAFCTATLTTAISALYPPPASGPRTPAPWLPILGALAGLLLFVLGRRWMPRQRRRAYACCGLGAFLVVAAGIAGCGGGSSGGTGGGTVRTINAVYSGDANYTGSPGSTSITVR